MDQEFFYVRLPHTGKHEHFDQIGPVGNRPVRFYDQLPDERQEESLLIKKIAGKDDTAKRRKNKRTKSQIRQYGISPTVEHSNRSLRLLQKAKHDRRRSGEICGALLLLSADGTQS